MVDGEALTSAALASAICSGDSPRATSDLIRPVMYSNSASSRSTPILDSRSSASAAPAPWPPSTRSATAGRSGTCGTCTRCSNAAHDNSFGHAPSGRPGAPPPCPALATQRARHLVGDRRRRSAQLLAICLQDLRLSRPLSIAARSALSSLRYGVGCLLPHAFPFSREAFGPRLRKESSELSRTCPAEFRTKAFG